MGITNSNKQIDKDSIDCGGVLKVAIALSAAPDISSNPTDIVLILDRSGSMAGRPLANMKQGAKTFIDIIDEATDSSQDGNIGSGSRIGIVSFAGTTVDNTQLITSAEELKNAVDSLTAGGSTNPADAFLKALQLFDPLSSNEKVIVMFTDGKTTAGPPPESIAEAAKDAGVIIYCIGLIGTDGIDVETLNEWASDPDAAHVAVTPDDSKLEELFRELGANISKAGATNIMIDEVINSDFEIINIIPPVKGNILQIDANTLRWKMEELGVSGEESAVLEFYIRHISQEPGEKEVNEFISYSDDEGNEVIFPNPRVNVECSSEVIPEPCPEPIDITIKGCQDFVEIDAGDVYLESQGSILRLNVTIKNVCPGKRAALAVILTETDDNGKEYPRGMKTFTIPAHNRSGCQDVQVKCIEFVLPEDLDVSEGNPKAMCNSRHFKARFVAHYIDTDFKCCK